MAQNTKSNEDGQKKGFSFDQLIPFLEKNSKPIGLAIFFFVLLGIATIGWEFLTSTKEQSAQTEIHEVSSLLQAKLNEGNPKPKDPMGDMLPKAALKKEDVAKNADLIQKYKDVIEKNKSRRAAWTAALDLSNQLIGAEDYPAAASVLKIVVDEPRSSDIFYGLLRLSAGTLALSQQQSKEAVDLFSSVVKEKSQSHLHPAALVKLGLAYEASGEADKAKETYAQVRNQFPQTSAAQAAGSYLRDLQINPGTIKQ